MTPADFSQFVVTTDGTASQPACETSSGKDCIFLLMHLPHLLCGFRIVIEIRLLLQTHPPMSAYYAVSVRQVEGLRPATFKIPPHGRHPCHSLMLPTIRALKDFHRLVIVHVGRTKQEPRG